MLGPRRVASGGWDGCVRVWRLRPGQESDGRQEQCITVGMPVHCVAAAPDAHHIAAGAGDWQRGECAVWDARSGAPKLLLRGPLGSVECVGWSPDGAHVAAGSQDRVVRVWAAARAVALQQDAAALPGTVPPASPSNAAGIDLAPCRSLPQHSPPSSLCFCSRGASPSGLSTALWRCGHGARGARCGGPGCMI